MWETVQRAKGIEDVREWAVVFGGEQAKQAIGNRE
jgi:hypothetical protein